MPTVPHVPGVPRIAGQGGGAADGGALHAVYDNPSRTIYLPEDWSTDSPAGLSVLVHEMVNHLQNVAGLAYPCAAARERPAYRAQARWLGLFGTTLEAEFGVDPMTLLVRTTCVQ